MKNEQAYLQLCEDILENGFKRMTEQILVHIQCSVNKSASIYKMDSRY